MEKISYNRFSFNIRNNNFKNISFEGTRKVNSRLAEEAVKAFHDEFHFRVKSPTRLKAKIDKHEHKLRYEKIMPRLDKLLSFHVEDLADFKHNMKHSGHIDNIEKIKHAIRATKVADCPYQSEIVANYLKEKGADVQRLTMVIKDGKDYIFHIFPIIDLSPKCHLDRIGTWGKNAVIADPWINHTGKASDVINYLLHDVFKVDPEKQKVSFFITKEPF